MKGKRLAKKTGPWPVVSIQQRTPSGASGPSLLAMLSCLGEFYLLG
jgi:hypothetical protein